MWDVCHTHLQTLQTFSPDAERFMSPHPHSLGEDEDSMVDRNQREGPARVWLCLIHPHLVHPTMLGCFCPHRATWRDPNLYGGSMQP